MTARGAVAAGAAALLLALAPSWAAAGGTLAVAGGIGVPGGLVPVTVSLDGVGEEAVAADAGLAFDAGLVQADFGRCRLAPRLSATHGLGGRVIGSTLIVSVFARGLPPLPTLGDGEIVRCELRIAAGAPPGPTDVRTTSVVVANGNGDDLEVAGSDGRVLVVGNLLGDTNCDAMVDAEDLGSLIGAIFARLRTCPSTDVNADALVSAADLTAEAALLAGLSARAPAAVESWIEGSSPAGRGQVRGSDVRASTPRGLKAVEELRIPSPSPLPEGEEAGLRMGWIAQIAPAAVRLTVGTARLAASGQGSVDVMFESGGQSVAGALNDIAIPSGVTIPERAVTATELAVSVDADDATIEVSDASGLPDFGIVVVEGERIGYGAKLGNSLLVAERGRDGTAAAAHAQGAALELPLAIPDCAPSEELAAASKSAVFSYLPAGCTAGADCAVVRAAILALDDVGAIPSGIPLYRCRVETATADGTYPLDCGLVQAAAVPPESGALAASCADGRVEVGETKIVLGRASGPPGTSVTVSIDVSPGPATVGALNVDVVFDPDRVSVDSVPCMKAPRLTGHRLTLGVIDPGRVRLVVFGLDFPVPPITAGPVATCRFNIAGDSVPGEQIPLGGERIQIADGEGAVICGVGSPVPCALEGGRISVVPAPTPTPTATPTPTLTVPRPTATPRPCAGDCDGGHRVSINELMLGVGIANGLAPLAECPTLDASGDGEVDVAEIVAAVVNAIDGCS